MKKVISVLSRTFLVLILLGILAAPALAQSSPAITLHLTKVIGYMSGFWSSQKEGQGILQVSADVPSGVSQVVFYLDGSTVMGQVDQAPYKLQFQTGSYALGQHTITAVGTAADGTKVNSDTITVSFVTAAKGLNVGLNILLPILAVLLLAFLLQFGLSALTRRKMASLPAGTPRSYGIKGGAICPRCHRPFVIPLLSMNLIGGSLASCPFCGRFGIFTRKSTAELRAAEAAELADAKSVQVPEESEEEKLRKELDASRYQDH